MPRYNTILDAIGHTPLVRLHKLTAGLASTIDVKVEALNPGGSVKDRPARYMLEAAERAGLLKPGGTIVEATAGNTGAGLAQAAAVKGYKLIVVLPDKMSGEKIGLLRAYGAEVVITPTSVAPDSPESYNGVAARLAREIPGAFRPAQFDNPDNPLAHYLSTGPEIWSDTQGEFDVFVAGMGTGGTISGIGKFLKELDPAITVVGADPEGSILSGDTPRAYKVEGIGEDFIPKTFNRQVVDEMVRVSDKDSFNTARRLAREEGILAGGSSGTALAAALAYARRLTEPKRIVVLLPDTGRNYLSKMYSDAWMRENGYWEDARSPDVPIGSLLAKKGVLPSLISVSPHDKLSHAIALIAAHQISQIPVIENHAVVGSLNESSVMKTLHDGIQPDVQEIRAVMGAPLPSLDEAADLSEAYRLLFAGAPAIVVTRDRQPHGVVTRFDVIAQLSRPISR
ncbi:MAG TPA: cystathionine beta-synthase [Kiritimatiellia bacterium]|nr:cystathionine beta-synthase [Kiritimatiellia bacterium]HPS08659.1 cystathionine beta-synthase [Kiritimatiellia bacterium]